MVDIQGIAQSAVGIISLIAATTFLGALVIGFIWFVMKRKQYEYTVIWFSEDGITGGRDKAGVFVDGKTNYKKLFFKKARVGLNPDHIPFRMVGGKKTIFAIRYGQKNFRLIDMKNVSQEKFKAHVTEEDVNWAIVDYERQKKTFADSKLMQILPYAAIFFTGMIVLIMVIHAVNKLDALQEIMEIARQIAVANAEAATGSKTIN